MSQNSRNAYSKQKARGSKKVSTEKKGDCSFSIIEQISHLAKHAEGEPGFLNPSSTLFPTAFIISVTLFLFVFCSLWGITTSAH